MERTEDYVCRDCNQWINRGTWYIAMYYMGGDNKRIPSDGTPMGSPWVQICGDCYLERQLRDSEFSKNNK